jgi:hypothetical protein
MIVSALPLFCDSASQSNPLQTLSLWGASCCVTYVHYTNILYIYIYIYIHDPQSQLTTSLFLNFFTTCFGPYEPSSGENVSTSVLYSCKEPSHYDQYIHHFYDYITYLPILK